MEEVFNIIFVDDEKHALTLFKHTLKSELKSGSINLLTFSNGEDCLNYLKNNTVDMFIMFSDINMPVMDGFTLLDEVKRLHPHVDLFFISAYDLDDYKLRADSKGAKGFLTKPMNFRAIKSIINSYIQV